MLLKPVMPVFEYIFNYDYIVKELCENRDNLVMGCNGKCYLMKELAKASENEKPQSSDKKHQIAETNDLFLNEFYDYGFSNAFAEQIILTHSDYRNLYTHLQTGSFFHPPTVIA